MTPSDLPVVLCALTTAVGATLSRPVLPSGAKAITALVHESRFSLTPLSLTLLAEVA
jgi:hypothetical protein